MDWSTITVPLDRRATVPLPRQGLRVPRPRPRTDALDTFLPGVDAAAADAADHVLAEDFALREFGTTPSIDHKQGR